MSTPIPTTTPPPAKLGPYVIRQLRIQHTGIINLPEIEVYDMSNTNVAPNATLAMSSIYQNRKENDPMFGLQVGTDGWFVANKDGKHHMLHSGGGSVKTLTMTWPEEVTVRRIVIYNRDRGCGGNDIGCAKRIIGATVLGTNTAGANTLSYTIPDLRSVYVLGDACDSYNWPPAGRGAYEQAFRSQISACFALGGCLDAATGACLDTTPPPQTTTPAPATTPAPTTSSPQYPYAGRPLEEVIQELQGTYPGKTVMALEERQVETARLDFRITIVVVWRQVGGVRTVRQVMGIPGTPTNDMTTPAPTCPVMEEGMTVLDGSDGQLYRFENGTLRAYMTQDIYKSWGSPQYTVFPRAALDACVRGPSMALKDPAAGSPSTTTGEGSSLSGRDIYIFINGPTYDEDGTIRVLTVRFNQIMVQPYNQRDPAQTFVIYGGGRDGSLTIRSLSGSGEVLASNEGCLAPMTTTFAEDTGETSVQWTLAPAGGSSRYSYTLRAACGRFLTNAPDTNVVSLETQGSMWYVVPVGRIA